MRLPVLALVICLACSTAGAQSVVDPHRAAANRLIDAAVSDSAAYRRLARFVDRFGHRMSGSQSLENAIDWIVEEMQRDGLENVHTEPVTVTHWVRGNESAELLTPTRVALPILGLGRSVGTAPTGITAPVIVVRDFAELRRRAAAAKGKIVLFNFPFDTTVHPFVGYGQAVRYRAYGVDSAAAVGAVGVLVRSVTPHSLRTPHTGGLSYADTTRRVPRIPGAAVTVEDAEMLQRMQDRGEQLQVRLTMGARTLPPAQSRNIVAEIRGSERPHEIIVLGGHIDSWDVGQGAVDDAGGSVAAWEAVRLIKQLGVRPKRTIRVVLWTNEEIGLGGALAYRDAHRAELDDHIFAMESDNGVFRPRGLLFSGAGEAMPLVRQVAELLAPIGADSVRASGPQADVSPLFALGVPALAIDTDPSRYFWYHHTVADMVDKLDPREMALCVAVMAVVANTVGNMTERLPRTTAAAGVQRPAAEDTIRNGGYFARLAMSAQQRQDWPTYLRHSQTLAELAPSHPTVEIFLARAYAGLGKPALAEHHLSRAALAGDMTRIEDDSALRALHRRSTFRTIAERFAANRAPVTTSAVAFTLADPDLLPEGIAYDPRDGAFYLGSLWQRRVIRVARDGREEVIADRGAGLLRVVGMKVDTARNALWFATWAPGAERTTAAGTAVTHSMLFQYDLASERIVRSYAPPDSFVGHLLNDLVVTRGGDVYVTDTDRGAIYLMRQGRDALELFTRPDPRLFTGANGIALNADESRLYVAYAEGIASIDLGTRRATLLATTPGVSTVGIDGLYWHAGGLIAVQTLETLERVVRFDLDPSGLRVMRARTLERGSRHFNLPTTGVLVRDSLYYIANSQYDRQTDEGRLRPSATPTPTVILKVALKP